MSNSKCILIIEDEQDIRLLYSEVLRDEGYKVLEAENGTKGLEIARNSAWDLMLLDVMIPELDGISLLKLIKNEPDLKDKVVLMLTNIGNANLIANAFDIGAEGYLIKAEITPDNILEEVKNYL